MLQEHSKRLGQLAAIVESSDDVIVSKDLNGIITSWNAAATRVFGYTTEEMIGSSILKLIPENLHSDEKIIMENIRAGRRVTALTIEQFGVRGTSRRLRVAAHLARTDRRSSDRTQQSSDMAEA
jgi:PAS domain S-box-containing protein